MTRHRLAVAVAAIAYLGLGVRPGFAFVGTWSDPSSDLSYLEPAFDGVVAAVYVVGAVILARAAFAGQTRRVIAVPILLLPASALAFVLVLVVAGGLN